MAKGRSWSSQRPRTAISKAVNPSFTSAAASAQGMSTEVAIRPFGLLEALQLATGQDFGTFNPMARDPLDDTAFGPMDPLNPEPIDALNGVGRTDPRMYQYQVGWNLPGNGNREVPWQVLRAASQGVGIIRRCIEVRKRHVRQLRWSFGVSEEAITDAYQLKPEAGKLDAEQKLRERLMPEIARLREFWRKPWKSNDADMGQWINSVMEDFLVLDAVAIYPRLTYGGDVHDLEVIDATTIKPLLDHRGVRPLPPHPAFQQVLYGFPRGEWMASVEYDDQGNALVSDAYAESELFYRRENFRSFSPYGYSATEMALFDARLYLARQKWMLAEYDDGSTPLTWVETAEPQDGKAMTLSQQRQWEKAYNAKVSGQTKERHRIKLLPNGWKASQMTSVDERYKPEYDLHLIKLLASYYGVPIAELGFTEPTGLGNAGWHEGQAEVSGRLGLRPDTEVLTDIVNALSRQFLKMPAELEFSFVDPSQTNGVDANAVMDSQRARGTITMNEERQELGQSLLNFPEANMHFLTTPTGPIFLEGAKKRADDAAAQAQLATQTQALGTAGKLHIEEKRLEDGQSARAENRDFTREQMAAQAQADVNKAAEISAYRNWRRKHPEDEQHRPFIFKHVSPDDGFAELDGIGPWRVQYEGWEWLIDGEDLEKGAKSVMSWLEWNAKNPGHPRGPHGRWVKVATGTSLIESLQEEGKRANAPDAAGRVVGASSSLQGMTTHEQNVRDAYAELNRYPGGWVALADLRERVPQMTHQEWTQTLKGMIRQDDVTIIPEADQSALRQRDRDAAPYIGGEYKHVIAIENSMPSGVQLARQRQTKIDVARGRAEVLAEMEEILFVNQGEHDVATRRFEGTVNRLGMGEDPHVPTLRTALASGDPEAIHDAMDRVANESGLERIGGDRWLGPDQLITYTRAEHEDAFKEGLRPGQRGLLVRPGYFATIDGERVRLSKARVSEATPAEIRQIERLIDDARVARRRTHEVHLEDMKTQQRRNAARDAVREKLNNTKDPKDNAAKLKALNAGDVDAVDLYRRIEAGPSGQRSTVHVGRLRYTPDNRSGEYQVVAADGSTAGWLTRSVRNGEQVYVTHSENYEGAIKLEGWAENPVVASDVLLHGVHAATGRHDSRRISAGKFEVYRPKSLEEWDRESETRLARERAERDALRRGLGLSKAGEPDPKAPTQQSELPQEVPAPDMRWPGWLLDTVIAAAVTEVLLGAMPRLNLGPLLRDFLTWSQAYQPGDPVPDVRLWIANLPAAVRPDIEALIAPAIEAAHLEGALVGRRSAEVVAQHVLNGNDVRNAVEFELDWGNWTPGHSEAARILLTPGGLDQLLYQSRATIKTIADNRLDQLGGILGRGLQAGETPENIARELQGFVDDPAWARRIAVTETNRAMSYASVQQYLRDGLEYKGWMTAFDQRVCRTCLNNELNPDGTPRIVPINELFPSGDPWPPAHPHCRCAPIPVVQFPRGVPVR